MIVRVRVGHLGGRILHAEYKHGKYYHKGVCLPFAWCQKILKPGDVVRVLPRVQCLKYPVIVQLSEAMDEHLPTDRKVVIEKVSDHGTILCGVGLNGYFLDQLLVRKSRK